MTFCYSENEPRMSGSHFTSYENQNAVRNYLTHYGNYLYLNFIMKHPETSYLEKTQASKELEICERKMKHWERHPNFNIKEVEVGKSELSTPWENVS